MRGIEFRPKAFEQMNEWLITDRKILQKILRLLKECQVLHLKE